MDELFDTLAKASVGKAISRRQAFRRFGWGMAVAALGAVGVVRARAEGNSCVAKCCQDLCIESNTPGRSRGECMSACMQGENIQSRICEFTCS
jgi:hypothetical protein